MVLNPIFVGEVWFMIHRYSVFHTFIWRGWMGGLSQMKLASFEKKTFWDDPLCSFCLCFYDFDIWFWNYSDSVVYQSLTYHIFYYNSPFFNSWNNRSWFLNQFVPMCVFLQYKYPFQVKIELICKKRPSWLLVPQVRGKVPWSMQWQTIY